jgi:hypothetical protein
MKKIIILPAWLLCAGAVVAVSPPSEPTELNWSRRPVLFSHRTHLHAPMRTEAEDPSTPCPERRGEDGGESVRPVAADERCPLCHHPVDGTVRYLTCATRGCHDNLNPKDTSVRSYYAATHAVTKGRFYTCVSCHTEQAGDDAATMKRMVGCERSVCHE